MDQFSNDVAANPNDTEETIWHFLSNARYKATVGRQRPADAVAAARRELLPIGHESRPVMRTAMALFAGTGTPEALAGLAGTDPHTNAYFYSNLYLGLYLEAIGRTEESRGAIVRAATSTYG